ncbi:hypothetical protein N7463_008755 [Penicillium fimorum]|uniref:Ankyrin repeat-containing domain n=1 Tax=Penicillium fimorum TaxID=1882269 RepID=A0A9W9XPJ2_9EURO|nr:hypothetical protein N7463_008755 [Penicillium fimorum]
MKKHIGILELFLSRGWDINTDINDMVPSALVSLQYYMYTFEDVGLPKWFLSHDANTNKRCLIRNCTPPSYAVGDGLFDVIKILFENGGRVNMGSFCITPRCEPKMATTKCYNTFTIKIPIIISCMSTNCLTREL